MSHRKVLRRISTPITLIILLGVLGYGVYKGYEIVTAEPPTTPPPACVTMPMSELRPESVTVNVYNGGTLRGLAGRIADTLEEGGFIIADVTNTETPVMTLLIIGAAADSPEVRLVASWFNDPEIRADDRLDHSVDILVGSSYEEETAMVEEPPESLIIPSGRVCLPQTPTPTATPTATDTPTDATEPT